MRQLCSFTDFPNQVIATAIHAGHELRPTIAASTALDDTIRLREEDPFTDRLTAIGAATVVAHRSRFEVDLNRSREQAVYRVPEDAWGLDLWMHSLSDHEIQQSLELYDDFYRELGRRLDEVAARGPFVVLDLHSYNHRRDGADEPPQPVAENPEINVGTGSLDRDRWGAVVDAFHRRLRSPRRARERPVPRRRAQSLGERSATATAAARSRSSSRRRSWTSGRAHSTRPTSRACAGTLPQPCRH